MVRFATILLAGTAVTMAAPAIAQDGLEAEVAHSWTSGGEAAALAVIQAAFAERGGVWSDSSIAGFENGNAAFMSRILAGDPPTAKTFIVGQQPLELIRQGLMADIDAVAAAADISAVLPPLLLDAITVDGHVYMAPISVGASSYIFYSTAVFEQAGITAEPASWDELFAALDRIRDIGLTPVAWGGQAWQENIVFNLILFSQLGVEGYDALYVDRDATVAESAEFAAAVEIFGRLRAYVDDGAPGRNWNDATAMVINGEAGVQLLADFAKGEFTAAGMVPGVDYGCMTPPGHEGMVVISDAFTFPLTGNEADDAAQALLASVVLDPEVQAAFSLLKGSIPARTDADTSALDACAQIAASYLAEGLVAPDIAIVLDPSTEGALKDAVAEFWSDPAMPAEELVEQYAAIIGR